MLRHVFTKSRPVTSHILRECSGGAPRRVFCSAKTSKTSEISLALGLSAGTTIKTGRFSLRHLTLTVS